MSVLSLGATTPVWPWLIVLGGLILIGGIGIYAARTKIRESEAFEADFSLGELKDMVAQGKMTEVEYKAAREVILRKMDKSLSDNGKPKAK
jgi:hypothetical protein